MTNPDTVSTPHQFGNHIADPRGDLSTVIVALKNSGIDTECGACMEVAFTGVTTNQHTCPSAAQIDAVTELLEACKKTLRENGHLADGDNCTLINLVRAVAKADGQLSVYAVRSPVTYVTP